MRPERSGDHLVGSTWNSHATTYLAAHDIPDEHIDTTPLLLAAEAVLRQGPGRVALQRLCQALAALTHEKAELRLHASPHPRMNRASLPPGAYQLPVQYHHRAYGSLIVQPASAQPDQPALSDTFAQHLAYLCGMLLFLLEQAALIEILSRHLAEEVIESLTPRQQEVLALIAQGQSDGRLLSRCASRQRRYASIAWKSIGAWASTRPRMCCWRPITRSFSHFLCPRPKSKQNKHTQ